MKTDWYKIAKVVIAVVALFFFYLYVLNGRYYINNGVIVDKWLKEVYHPNKWISK